MGILALDTLRIKKWHLIISLAIQQTQNIIAFDYDAAVLGCLYPRGLILSHARRISF